MIYVCRAIEQVQYEVIEDKTRRQFERAHFNAKHDKQLRIQCVAPAGTYRVGRWYTIDIHPHHWPVVTNVVIQKHEKSGAAV